MDHLSPPMPWVGKGAPWGLIGAHRVSRVLPGWSTGDTLFSE